MGLTKYKEKRDFKKTPEPSDKASKTKKDLRFVIQRHQARRLHYDLRLEMEGVLKSWAVPKGPSMNPEDKRLAMMTEDHPYKYVDFEGVIPEGNYGAGIMDVYDTGIYHAPGIKDKKKSEQALLKGLEEGNLKIELEGEKIKGTFALVKMKGKQENAWLLVKKDDEYAVDEEYSSEDYIDDLTSVKKGIKKEKKKKAPGSKAKGSNKHSEAPAKEMPTQPFPHEIKPMLAKVKEAPFDNEEWIFELKYDGYRAIAEIEKGEVRIYSRNLNSFNTKFKPLTEKLQNLGHEAVLDGEVVILNKEGKPEFQLLQNFQKTRKGELHYYVFDLLYLNGYELYDLPLVERKKFLKEILKELDDPSIVYSDHVRTEGIAFFKEAQDNKLEGVIAKKADSTYQVNSRSNNWLKIKTSMRQEAVIAGFTEPKGSRKTFGALVLGVYEKGKLEYIGHTGGGFNGASLKMVMDKMKPLIRKTSPFSKKIKTNTPVTWIKPELVCEISFSEWTDEGSMRHPIFQGLREDKPAKEVVREAPYEIPDGEELMAGAEKDDDKKTAAKKKSRSKKEESPKEPATKQKKSPVGNKKSAGKTSKNTLPKIDKKDKEKEVKLDGHTFQLTRLDKIYWPEEGYTKGDVIRHYLEISEFILPYLKDRPENMLRHPNGIEEKGFFHKDVTELNMEWLETVKVYSESNDKDINYLICNNQATLTYMNQLGCIEINPWNSRVQSLDKPDWIVIDLDPADNTFDEVIETALAVKEVLDKAGADSYIKTSGSSGMHIFIPMGAQYDYEQAKNFAHVIAQLTHEKLPKLTSLKRSPKDRKKQIYLDYLQNRKGQTLSVVYSVRPKPGATVSTPLQWKEVKKGLHPSQFTIKNIQKRLKKYGDLFKGILGPGIDMEKCLENLSS